VVGEGLRFALLGPIRAWRDGVELDLGSPQQRATLAVLLLRAGAPVSAEELVDAVWSDDPPRAAIGAIRTYVYRLRRGLAAAGQPPVIESIGAGYALRTGPDTIDLGLFRSEVARARQARAGGEFATASSCLHSALARWNGIPLGAVKGAFAQTQRAALVRLRLVAIEDLLDVDLELGHHARAVAELSTLVEEYPLHERLRELLMLALYRSGRQAEALRLFRDTSRLLADELGVDPGPGLRQMQGRILAADPGLILPAAAAPAPGQSSPGQCSAAQWLPVGQLPPDFPDFVGRAQPLARIGELLARPDAVGVVGIAGLAGVGKTALAVRAGHALQARFPDGQVFVTLSGADDERADPHDVLGFLLRSLGVSGAELPDAVGQRAALWRSALSGRRVLMILDDARDSAQIWPLLAGSPGCAAIVTSQRRLVEVPGGQWFTLDALGPDEAIELFERIAGRDRVRAELEATRRLARAFSGLPLPIRTAASRLNARPHWAVTSVQAHLCDELRRSTSLQDDCRVAAAPLERAHRRLDERQARAFRLGALADGPCVSASSAAVLLGCGEDEAERLLESLADLHLIEVDGSVEVDGSAGASNQGRGHYRYRYLVREFARYLAFQIDGRHGSAPGRLYAVG
jgi:DNA-binding SARP family transcriptional activator